MDSVLNTLSIEFYLFHFLAFYTELSQVEWTEQQTADINVVLNT